MGRRPAHQYCARRCVSIRRSPRWPKNGADGQRHVRRHGGINRIDGRREFNWWFDPEAVRIAMRAPWKKITITPIDISVKTTVNPEVKAAIAKARHADGSLSHGIFGRELHVG